MPDATVGAGPDTGFACADLTTFCRLDELGLEGACTSADPPSRPAGRLFQALARLRLLPASGHDPPGIPTPPPLQAKLLELLDVDPTPPRWAD